MYQLKSYHTKVEKEISSPKNHLMRSDISQAAAGQLSNQVLYRLLIPDGSHKLHPEAVIQRELGPDDKPKTVEYYQTLLKKFNLAQSTHTDFFLNDAIAKCSSLDEAKSRLDDDLLEYKMMEDSGSSEPVKIPMEYPHIEPSASARLTSILEVGKTDPRRLILALIHLYPEFLVPRFAENSIEADKEDMPYYHHAQMVMGQFNKYFAGGASASSDIISDDLMRMMLALHDVDKLRSIARHGKIGEHMDTVSAMKHFSQSWSFTPPQRDIAAAMTAADPFGDFFKEIDVIFQNQKIMKSDELNKLLTNARERCIRQILVQATRAQVPKIKLSEFFDRYVQFYQSDYSSYSTDSGYTDKHKAGGHSDVLYPGPDSFTPERFKRKTESPLTFDKTEAGDLKFQNPIFNDELVKLREMISGESTKGFSESDSELQTAIDKQISAENSNEEKRLKLEATHERATIREAEIKELNFEDFLNKVYLPQAATGGLLPLIESIASGAEPLTSMEEPEKSQWIAYCQRITALGSSTSAQIQQDFSEPLGGAFIRKLLPEREQSGMRSQNSARTMLEKERNSILNTILRQPLTPFVLPATYVVGDVPTSLTDAQGGLLHSSGLIYDKDVKLAPSSKEHNESAHLSHVLTNHARPKIHDEETWRGIVRATIHPIGGTTYETREDLALKMHEMEDRRSGISPDLSTKELLMMIIAEINGDDSPPSKMVDKSLFTEVGDRLTTSPAVKIQLLNAFLLYSKDKQKICLNDIPQRKAPREDRKRSIYGGGKRGLPPGNRYHLSDGTPPLESTVSSEQDGYSGKTFQTNEALLLPDDLDHIVGIYVNRHTLPSIVHAINLAMEFFIQTGKLPPFFTYEALEGLRPTDLAAIFGIIEQRLQREESLTGETPAASQPTALGGPDSAAPPPDVPTHSAAKVSDTPITQSTQKTVPGKLAVSNFFGLANLMAVRAKWLPESKEPKMRK